jgi:hypothetical protein
MALFRLLFLLALFAYGAAQPVWAQEQWNYTPPPATDQENLSAAPQPQIENQKPLQTDIMSKIMELPPEMQDELLAESQKAAEYCQQDYWLPQYYDCSCLGLKFLESRYEKGPEEVFINFINTLDLRECISMPMIAGMHYQRCKRFMEIEHLKPQETEAICECTSRKIVEEFNSIAAVNLQYLDDKLVPAINDCKMNAENPLQKIQ